MPELQKSFSIRHGSFFAAFRNPIADVWSVMLCWLKSIPITVAVEMTEVPKRSVIRIYNALRELVMGHNAADSVRLGGPGIICEIDESLMSHKRKYNRGRVVRRPIWSFGIVDTSFTPARGYMQIVSDRRKETLLPIIQRVRRDGTIIRSDEWSSYREIERLLGMTHETVNHSVNFVNPATGAHTQHVESYWNRIKTRIKTMRGLKREKLNAFLAELMWQDIHRGVPLSSF